MLHLKEKNECQSLLHSLSHPLAHTGVFMERDLRFFLSEASLHPTQQSSGESVVRRHLIGNFRHLRHHNFSKSNEQEPTAASSRGARHLRKCNSMLHVSILQYICCRVMITWSRDWSSGTVGTCVWLVRLDKCIWHLLFDKCVSASRDIRVPIYGDR